jgi:hypothetical protein
MKLVSEYLAQAHHFEHLAARETSLAVKKRMLEQAEAYHKLAKMRAINLGEPIPDRPSPPPPPLPQPGEQPALQQEQIQRPDDDA